METLNITIGILLIILSYFIGSIPFGLIFGKLICKKDLRELGSKNIGSTNAIRFLGKKVGFLVFFCDVLKGALVIILIKILASVGIWNTPESIDLIYYGLAAILGHSFSIYLGFKGGKAVATSLGVVLVLTPSLAIICLIVFLLLLFTTGYVSIASSLASISVLVSCWIFYANGITEVTNFIEYFIAKPSLTQCIIFTILVLLIIFKHRSNYVRILNGTEYNHKTKR